MTIQQIKKMAKTPINTILSPCAMYFDQKGPNSFFTKLLLGYFINRPKRNPKLARSYEKDHSKLEETLFLAKNDHILPNKAKAAKTGLFEQNLKT